jgi:hypothetical protein
MNPEKPMRKGSWALWPVWLVADLYSWVMTVGLATFFFSCLFWIPLLIVACFFFGAFTLFSGDEMALGYAWVALSALAGIVAGSKLFRAMDWDTRSVVGITGSIFAAILHLAAQDSTPDAHVVHPTIVLVGALLIGGSVMVIHYSRSVCRGDHRAGPA